MKIKPILFNTDMVKAILDGRKTVTRRVVKPQPETNLLEWLQQKNERKIPYDVGDILYVRETWTDRGDSSYMYKADYRENEKFYRGGKEVAVKWKPSLFMPKEAARIFLRVTNVSVTRLQDMTDNDVAKEGVPGDIDYPISSIYCPYCKGEGLVGTLHSGTLGYMEVECNHCDTRIKRFKNLWDFTIKQDIDKYGWSANPWAWIIEFERREKPEEF